jgi:hypothetical protein
VPTKNPLRAPISSSVAPGPRSGELPPLRHPLLQFPLRRQEFLELELDDAHVPYIYLPAGEPHGPSEGLTGPLDVGEC